MSALDATNALRIYKHAVLGKRAAFISLINSHCGIVEDAWIDGKRIGVAIRNLTTNEVRRTYADKINIIEDTVITNG